MEIIKSGLSSAHSAISNELSAFSTPFNSTVTPPYGHPSLSKLGI